MIKLKRIICAALASALLLGCMSSCGGDKKSEPLDMKAIALSEEQIADVRSEIDSILEECDFSGAAFVKLNKNVIYENYIGFTDEARTEKVSSNTYFQVSSLTKNITGIAVLQLIEAGKLSIDDRLSKFFEAKGDRAYLDEITVGDLVSTEKSFGTYNHELFRDRGDLDYLLDAVINGKSIKKYIADHILDNGLETKSSANSNYYLLGLIIEKVSGEKYEDYIQKNIFDKLGMKNSEVVNPKRPLSGYNVDRESWRDEKINPFYNNFEFMFSSYGVCLTIDDMRKFYEAILNNRLTDSNIADKIDDFSSGYGYGFTHDGHNLFAFGSTSLHTAYAYVNTETDELVLLCSNRTGSIKLESTGKELYNAVNAKINGILIDYEQ